LRICTLGKILSELVLSANYVKDRFEASAQAAASQDKIELVDVGR